MLHRGASLRPTGSPPYKRWLQLLFESGPPAPPRLASRARAPARAGAGDHPELPTPRCACPGRLRPPAGSRAAPPRGPGVVPASSAGCLRAQPRPAAPRPGGASGSAPPQLAIAAPGRLAWPLLHPSSSRAPPPRLRLAGAPPPATASSHLRARATSSASHRRRRLAPRPASPPPAPAPVAAPSLNPAAGSPGQPDQPLAPPRPGPSALPAPASAASAPAGSAQPGHAPFPRDSALFGVPGGLPRGLARARTAGSAACRPRPHPG
nr:skin secretory protein xP2-like [Aegilops tauschii subsp. strangulata]